MSTPFARKKKRLDSSINVVPYIDVMLVLLVIFMVTAPLITAGVQVNLPKADAAAITTQSLPLIINLTLDEELTLTAGNGEPELLGIDSLVYRLTEARAQDPNVAILINADGDNRYGAIMAVTAALQQAGVTQVGFLTRSADS